MTLFFIALYIGLGTFLFGFLSVVKIQYQEFVSPSFLEGVHRAFFMVFLCLFLATSTILWMVSQQKNHTVSGEEVSGEVVHY